MVKVFSAFGVTGMVWVSGESDILRQPHLPAASIRICRMTIASKFSTTASWNTVIGLSRAAAGWSWKDVGGRVCVIWSLYG